MDAQHPHMWAHWGLRTEGVYLALPLYSFLPHILWDLHHDNLGSRIKAHALDGGPWFACSLDLKLLVLLSCRLETAIALFTLSQGLTGQPRVEMTNDK